MSVERQSAIEIDMRQRGFAKALKASTAAGGWDKGALKPCLLQPNLEALESEIASTLLGWMGKSGSPNKGVRRLLQVSPDKLAAIALDCCLTAVSHRTTLVKLGLVIGRSVETQHKLEAYADHAEQRFNWLYKEALKRSSSANRIRYGLLHSMAADGVPHTSWSRDEITQAGLLLIDCVIRATGVIEESRIYSKKRFTSLIVKTDKTHEMIDSMLLHKMASTVQYGPMVCPPVPWRRQGSRYVGGYLTPELQIPLIRTKSRVFKDKICQHDMGEHVDAVNALQSVSYQVDKESLQFAQHLLDVGHSILPIARELPAPVADLSGDSLKKWKAAAREVHEWNAKLEGKQLQTRQLLISAWEYCEEPAIWFPVNCDFRGRMNYWVGGSLLTPQGGDLCKSLLRFSQPSLVDGGSAWDAFRIHGANEFGIKGTLSERIQWVQDHKDILVACALQPLQMDFWQQADKPLCFLRWCREFVKGADGKPFLTRIAVHADGTCNGLQHLSAMTHDSHAARAVNMLPSERPIDMYQLVADQLRIDMETLKDPLDIEYALLWLQHGWDRSLTKRQCMTKAYGSTMRSCTEYTMAFITEALEAGGPDVFGEHRHPAAVWMAQRIWDAINRLVKGPQATMDWLKAVARIYNKAGTTMEWTTPTGFLVHHFYPEWKSRQIKCFIDGREVKPRVRVEGDGAIAKADVVNGISANFTHSMDAAHLARIILAMREKGHGVWAIHDSIGCAPAAYEDMQQIIRETFIDLYEDNPLSALAVTAETTLDVEIPALPEMGDLDFSEIRQATYFFS